MKDKDTKTRARELAEKAMEEAKRRAAKSGRTVMEEAREMQYYLQEYLDAKLEGRSTDEIIKQAKWPHEDTPKHKYLSKAHQETSEAKMKSIQEWQKSPLSSEEMDKVIQEHFDAHNQVNPNKKVSDSQMKITNIKYLNQFHKESVERKIRKIEEWNKIPTTYEKIMENQRRREEQAARLEKWGLNQTSKPDSEQ
jgi:hypothetical protein